MFPQRLSTGSEGQRMYVSKRTDQLSDAPPALIGIYLCISLGEEIFRLNTLMYLTAGIN